MTAPDAGRVLRRALVAWGLGHLAIGRLGPGRALLVAELLAIGFLAWLTAGLADSSAYLIPYLAGIAFIVAWAWQAVDAYHGAHRLQPARAPAPARSPAAAIGWLSLPLLVWGAGFWLIGGHAATPAGVLDRFVTQWNDGEFSGEWPGAVIDQARAASDSLRSSADRIRDVRVRIVEADDARATAVAEAIHFERRDAHFLGIFAGSALVPVADEVVLRLNLVAHPVELPGGGQIGAVRWRLVEAPAP